MFYRRSSDLEKLIVARSGRNVLIQFARPGTTHAMICYTGHVLSVHFGIISGGFQHIESVYFPPAGVHDGHGWNLFELICLVEEL